jgi:hypothetical protein
MKTFKEVNEAMVQVAGDKKPSGAKILAMVIAEALTEEGYLQAKNVKDIEKAKLLIQEVIIKTTF